MPRALVVADEVDEALWCDATRAAGVDLLLAAGDLPNDYLEYLADAFERPAVLVPGNHDPKLDGYRRRNGMWLRAGFPAQWPGPTGWLNADGTVIEAAGLRIAGLGGCLRYSEGPNQWTEPQQARRARRLIRRASTVDVLLTHAPPLGVGDREDPAHRGFACLHDVIAATRPRWVLHGHIHPYGDRPHPKRVGDTTVRNVVGSHVIDLESARSPSS